VGEREGDEREEGEREGEREVRGKTFI